MDICRHKLMSQICSHIVWKDQETSLNNLCASIFEKKIVSQHHIQAKLSSLSRAMVAFKHLHGPKFKFVADGWKISGLERQLVLNPPG